MDRLQVEHANLRAALVWSERSGGAGELLGRLAGALWRFWWMRGHTSEGRSWLDRALAASAEPVVRSQQLNGAAGLAFFQDDYQRSREFWLQFIAHSRSTGRPTDTVLGLARALPRSRGRAATWIRQRPSPRRA